MVQCAVCCPNCASPLGVFPAPLSQPPLASCASRMGTYLACAAHGARRYSGSFPVLVITVAFSASGSSRQKCLVNLCPCSTFSLIFPSSALSLLFAHLSFLYYLSIYPLVHIYTYVHVYSQNPKPPPSLSAINVPPADVEIVSDSELSPRYFGTSTGPAATASWRERSRGASFRGQSRRS